MVELEFTVTIPSPHLDVKVRQDVPLDVKVKQTIEEDVTAQTDLRFEV